MHVISHFVVGNLYEIHLCCRSLQMFSELEEEDDFTELIEVPNIQSKCIFNTLLVHVCLLFYVDIHKCRIKYPRTG